MRIAIMQPYFIPYIGYFQLIAAVDKFIILDDVNYINRGWINRNRISINNQPHWLTIPLLKASQNKLIKEIDIVNSDEWKRKMLQTIYRNYAKAPFFPEVYHLFEEIINFDSTNLSTFIYNSLLKINEYLDISTNILPTSSIYPKNGLKGQDRILDICLRENADAYYNAIGGKEIYSSEVFAQSNIKLLFVATNFSAIKLKHNSENENQLSLSIINLMMFNQPSNINKALLCYKVH